MDLNLPKPDDIATICYASGTTGKELGVSTGQCVLHIDTSCGVCILY